jgi:DNA-binding MarR family transcriptional regulator
VPKTAARTSFVSGRSAHDHTVDDAVEVLMRSARLFAAITAESTARAGDTVTPPQLRVLVLASTRGPLNNTAVAAALNVHLSNASRICDRLVQADLLNRRDSPTDRRHVELTLTPKGRRLVETVMRHRRTALTVILERMPSKSRAMLQAALNDFNHAADAHPDIGGG